MASIASITNVATAPRARMSFSASVTADSVAATTVASQTFTVAGLTTDMVLAIQQKTPAVNAACVGGEVSAANTLKLHFMNPTAGAVTPSAGVYYIIAF